jgi:hypothetical protein
MVARRLKMFVLLLMNGMFVTKYFTKMKRTKSADSVLLIEIIAGNMNKKMKLYKRSEFASISFLNWLNETNERRQSVMGEFLATPIFESYRSDVCVGHVTHVSSTGSNFDVFYAIDSGKCNDRINLALIYSKSAASKAIKKLFIIFCDSPKAQHLGDLFDNTQTFILDREIY